MTEQANAMNQSARMQLDHDIPAVVVKCLALALECVVVDGEKLSADMADRASKRFTDEVDAILGFLGQREEVGVWLVTARADLATRMLQVGLVRRDVRR